MRNPGRTLQPVGMTVRSSARLSEVVLILRETLTPSGVSQWLTARNRVLGGRRPLEVLARGDANTVHSAAKAYIEGAYV